MKEYPLCTTCKWYVPETGSHYPRCSEPMVNRADGLAGSSRLQYCSIERSRPTNVCGSNGKQWKPDTSALMMATDIANMPLRLFPDRRLTLWGRFKLWLWDRLA